MNKKNELRELFHKYIDRKAKETSYSSSSYVQNPYYNSGGGGYTPTSPSAYRSDFNGCIYFYEWSDVNREPRKFFTIEGFNSFLKDSQIYLALFEKDIIKNLKWAYAACKKGTKNLIIRQSYFKLKEALEEEEKKDAEKKEKENHSIGFNSSKPSVNVPYDVAITRPPHMVEEFEPNGRWYG